MLRWIAIFVCFVLPAHAQEVAAEQTPPSLHETLVAARAAQGTDRPPDRWSSRARWRGVLPRIGAAVGADRTEELDLTFREYVGRSADDRLVLDSTQNTSEDDLSEKFSWRVTATWDLRDTIFSTAEIPAAREERAWRALRIRLDYETLDAYRDWRRADDPQARRHAIERLDLLTDGWFSRRTGGRR